MGNIPLEHGLIVATILFALGFLRCNGATQPTIYFNGP